MSWRRSKLTTRRDANEPALMKTMAKLGIYCVANAGPLDLWIYYRKTWTPIELKTATGQKTKAQKEFMAECDLLGAPYQLWREPDDIVRFANEAG